MTKAATISISHKSVQAEQNVTERKNIALTKAEWLWPVMFMFTMSLTGLRFPFGYLFLPIILINRFKYDKCQFLIMLTMALGGFGLTDFATTYRYTLVFLIVPVGIFGMFAIKKPPILKRAIALFAIYAASLFVFAFMSEEKMSIQLRGILNYLTIAYFTIPLLVFSGKTFDIQEFFKKLVPYCVIISIFYMVDAWIVCGNLLLPNTYIGIDGLQSTFWDIFMRPFSMHFVRKWPRGMLLISLIIYPAARYYKLPAWMWIVIAGGFISTRTFTVISGIIIAYFLFKWNGKKILRGVLIAIATFPLLYYIDSKLPETRHEESYTMQSTFRIKSSIDQLIKIINLGDMADDEDIAEVGSGRMGQVFPRFEYMFEKNREFIGVGFIDVNRSTDPKFLIFDEFSLNPWDAWVPVTRIEITPLQTILTIGIIGFLILTSFYVMLCVLTRKLKDHKYFYSIMFLYAWYGIGDFGGFIQPESLLVIGLAFSVIILANKATLGFALPVNTPKQPSPQH